MSGKNNETPFNGIYSRRVQNEQHAIAYHARHNIVQVGRLLTEG